MWKSGCSSMVGLVVWYPVPAVDMLWGVSLFSMTSKQRKNVNLDRLPVGELIGPAVAHGDGRLMTGRWFDSQSLQSTCCKESSGKIAIFNFCFFVFNDLKQRKTVNLYWFPVVGLTEAQEVERFSTNCRVDGSIPSPERLHVVMCPWARDISWTSLCSWWLFGVIVTLDVQLAARVCRWVKAHLCFKWLLRL